MIVNIKFLMTMKRTNQCYLRWLISVSVKNQYQHLYQLGTVPKNLSVPLHVANCTEKPFCTVDIITLNGTERFFRTIGRTVTETAPDRCYCSGQAFLTVCAKGRAGEIPVGEISRPQTVNDVVMVIA